MPYGFKGFLRNDGTVGTRNYIGVLSSVICSSVIAKEIAESHSDAIPIVHSNGCAQLGDDFKVTRDMLVGVAENPNFSAVLLVGLGCETNQISGLRNRISKNKIIEGIGIQALAGGNNTREKGVQIIKKWEEEVHSDARETFPLSDLTVGIVTEDIDEDSMNIVVPVISELIDLLVGNKATVIMGLSNRMKASAQVLANRTENSEVRTSLLNWKNSSEKRRWKTIDNEEYTLNDFSPEEEKIAALEAKLCGTCTIESLLNYGQKPKTKGFHLTMASGNIVETLSNMASMGCNVAITVSKRGVLTGSIALPCMTITPERSNDIFQELVDFEIIPGESQTNQVEQVLKKLTDISSGKQTGLEKLELGEFSIPHVGTTF